MDKSQFVTMTLEEFRKTYNLTWNFYDRGPSYIERYGASFYGPGEYKDYKGCAILVSSGSTGFAGWGETQELAKLDYMHQLLKYVGHNMTSNYKDTYTIPNLIFDADVWNEIKKCDKSGHTI